MQIRNVGVPGEHSNRVSNLHCVLIRRGEKRAIQQLGLQDPEGTAEAGGKPKRCKYTSDEEGCYYTGYNIADIA